MSKKMMLLVQHFDSKIGGYTRDFMLAHLMPLLGECMANGCRRKTTCGCWVGAPRMCYMHEHRYRRCGFCTVKYDQMTTFRICERCNRKACDACMLDYHYDSHAFWCWTCYRRNLVRGEAPRRYRPVTGTTADGAMYYHNIDPDDEDDAAAAGAT